MSPSGLTVAIAAMTVIGTLQAPAADLAISRYRQQPTARVSTSPAFHITRRHVVVHRYRIVRKSTGMLCMLPPHAIVQLNWNGPQCRWVDNII
jgi:hypothetical protein